MAVKQVLLFVSSVLSILGCIHLFAPAYAHPPVDTKIGGPFALFCEFEGLFCILLSALYCTVSRNATTAAIHSISITHLAYFFAILYFWDEAIGAGFTRTHMQTSAAFHLLVGLVLMGDAKAQGKPEPTGRSPQYNFSTFMSLVHFIIFLYMIVRPASIAKYVLGMQSTTDAGVMLTQIRLESLVHLGLSGLFCTNARSGSRSFSLGVASASVLAAIWAFASAALNPLSYRPECVLWTFGGFNAFVALYYFLHAPPAALRAKAVKAE